MKFNVMQQLFNKTIKSSSKMLLIAILIAFSTSWFLPKQFFSAAHFIADFMMKILKLISLPVISFSILSTISGMGNWYNVKTVGKKTIVYTILTTILAAM
jgi:Na+/H+-dicarboxylate symporter